MAATPAASVSGTRSLRRLSLPALHLQAEFSLTQVLDQPVTGRIFFEEVIRDNLDIGRPSQVSLVFDRKVNRRTPGPFRTRVITDGVVPSLYIDYKKTRIKQYHKEGQALRTETTINDTRDFAIGRRIENLEQLRKIGFAANRRLLDVQRIGHDCFIGEASFRHARAIERQLYGMIARLVPAFSGSTFLHQPAIKLAVNTGRNRSCRLG